MFKGNKTACSEASPWKPNGCIRVGKALRSERRYTNLKAESAMPHLDLQLLGPGMLAEPAIGALIPLLASDAKLAPLHTVRIIFVLSGQQPRVMVAVERLLPLGNKIATLDL